MLVRDNSMEKKLTNKWQRQTHWILSDWGGGQFKPVAHRNEHVGVKRRDGKEKKRAEIIEMLMLYIQLDPKDKFYSKKSIHLLNWKYPMVYFFSHH